MCMYVCICRLSPRYLPDFVLHGTSESADQAFQEKLSKDLAHVVKVCCQCNNTMATVFSELSPQHNVV